MMASRAHIIAAALVVAGLSAPVAGQERAATSDPVVIDRIVAVVDRAIILERELEARTVPQQIAAGGAEAVDHAALRRKVLDVMIEEALIARAARASGIAVTAEDLDRAIDAIKTQNGIDDAQLDEALEQQGYTMDSYRAEVGLQILRLKVINFLVGPQVEITDADIRARYEELRNQAGGALKPLADLEADLRTEIYRYRLPEVTARWMAAQRRNAHVEIRL